MRYDHKGLKNVRKASYTPSERPYRGLPEIDYPFHDKTILVTHCGRICIQGKKVNLSQIFAGQDVGIKEVADGVWLVTFNLCVRYKLLPICPVRTREKTYPHGDSNPGLQAENLTS